MKKQTSTKAELRMTVKIASWRSEIQHSFVNNKVQWGSNFLMGVEPNDHGVLAVTLGFYFDQALITNKKPSYVSSRKTIQLSYPYQTYNQVLDLITHSKTLSVTYWERANGEIDAFIYSSDQVPGKKEKDKHKKDKHL